MLQAPAFGSEEETNKVIFLKINDRQGKDKIENNERLQIERAIGSEMQGDLTYIIQINYMQSFRLKDVGTLDCIRKVNLFGLNI